MQGEEEIELEHFKKNMVNIVIGCDDSTGFRTEQWPCQSSFNDILGANFRPNW